MDAKEIKLREELDSIDETMALKRREIEDLKKKKEKLKVELDDYMYTNMNTLIYNSLKSDDPAIELLNMANDKDELSLDDAAFILGITPNTLRARVDSDHIKKYRRYDAHNTIMSRLEVGYIKSLLDMKKSDPKIRECVKYILEFYNITGFPLSISTPLKELEAPIKQFRSYRDMTICDLIAKGFGRGLITYPQHNTVERMLYSYNIGYRLGWLRSSLRGRTVYKSIKDDTVRPISVYIDKEK